MREVFLRTEEIGLVQFLKWTGLAGTGGEARVLVAEGLVTVNGGRETRCGRRLRAGDRVTVGDGEEILLCAGRGKEE
ncbi:MAG: RNA-binding S4 domain-containing protein [Patescibacteria group bacterium]